MIDMQPTIGIKVLLESFTYNATLVFVWKLMVKKFRIYILSDWQVFAFDFKNLSQANFNPQMNPSTNPISCRGYKPKYKGKNIFLTFQYYIPSYHKR